MEAQPVLAAPQPTGDALFDAFAALAQARWPQARVDFQEYVDYLIEWHGLDNLREKPDALRAALKRHSEEGMPLSRKNPDLWLRLEQAREPERMGVAELRSLEPGFGGDPRYWQLLHWAARQQRLDPEMDAWEFPAEAYSVLLEARERGAVDGATLLLLTPLYEAAADTWPQRQFELQGEVLARMSQEAQQARKAGHQPLPPPARHELGYFEQQGARAQELAARSGLDLPGLYSAALALSPDWAQLHYKHALYLHRRGKHLDAYAALKAGNGATRQRLLKPYPQSWVRELALRGEVAGSMKLFWDIEMHSTAEDEPALFVGLRTLPGAVAALLPPEQRLDPTTQLLRLLAHSGSAELASGFECQIAGIALSKTLDSALRFIEERAPDASGLAAAKSLAERLRTAAVNALQQSAQPGAVLPSDADMEELTSFQLDWDRSRAVMEPLYQHHFRQLLDSHRFCQSTLWPLLREALRIDLTTLAGA